MKNMLLCLATSFLFALQLQAEDKLLEHPLALQFRQHLLAADTNKDGYVTKEELAKEIQKSGRTAALVEEIAGSMIKELDVDQDGRLALKEIDAGTRATAIKAIIRDDAKTAEALLKAIEAYKTKNKGSTPQSVDDLLTAKFITKDLSMCTLGDGSEKPWIINSSASDSNSALVASPGSVDFEGQYIVGLVNGRVIGVHDKDLDDSMLKTLHVYPSK